MNLPGPGERFCLDCGQPLPPGRTDKRYCDDICRARATRKRNRDNAVLDYEDSHKAVIRALKRNYKLLKKAIDQREEWIVDFAVLYTQGFDGRFCTGSETLADGATRYYCFELGWIELDEARLLVSVNPERLETFNPGDFREIRFAEPRQE